MGKIASRHSLAFSECNRLLLAQLPRGTNVTHMNAKCTIRIAAQRTQGLRGPISVFWGTYDRQRMPAIRITAVTFAIASAITIARFRQSKPARVLPFAPQIPIQIDTCDQHLSFIASVPLSTPLDPASSMFCFFKGKHRSKVRSMNFMVLLIFLCAGRITEKPNPSGPSQRFVPNPAPTHVPTLLQEESFPKTCSKNPMFREDFLPGLALLDYRVHRYGAFQSRNYSAVSKPTQIRTAPFEYYE